MVVDPVDPDLGGCPDSGNRISLLIELQRGVRFQSQEYQSVADEEVQERLKREADELAASRTARFSPEIMRQVEKALLLQTLDNLWREHLVVLDHLRQVVGFRGYAQRDPLNEYKTEAFELFEAMLNRLREAVTSQLMRVEIVQRAPPLAPDDDFESLEATHINPQTGENEMADNGSPPPFPLPGGEGTRVAAAQRDPNNPATWGKVQRNAACPCGSGKKYKHCHGRLA